MNYEIQRLSGISDYERALLVGQFLSYDYGPTIDPRLLDRGYTEEQIRELKGKMQSGPKRSVKSCGLEFSGEIDLEYPYFSYVLELHEAYERSGVLPFHGGLAEQPAKVVEVLQIISQLKHDREQKLIKEMELSRKNGRHRHSSGRSKQTSRK